MEDIHGVDVSWLHHSNRDHHHRIQAPSTPGLVNDPPPKTSSHGGLPEHKPAPAPAPPAPTPAEDGAEPTPEKAPAADKTSAPAPSSPATPLSNNTKAPARRPSLLSRSSAEKTATLTAPEPAKTPSRRGSWITNLSAKFSSSPQSQALAAASPAPASSATQEHTPGHAAGQSAGANGTMKEAAEKLEPYVPQPPKAGAGSFFSNALRRLSSNSQGAVAGKVIPNGGVCPRRVMNVDPHRERCLVPELDQNKLRRVAFCVDVEIAGGPRYKDEDPAEKKKKAKDKKLKERGEGEALKHPQAVAQEKEKGGVVQVSGEEVGTDNAPNPEGTIVQEEKKETTRKKEKKKRSEAERKERKEKKHRKAVENGQIPLEITRDDDDSSGTASPSGTATPPNRSQDRPTIDPLRIYRRCCQLRETPILKRITEQLARPSTCPASTPGLVTCLDLTGSRLTLADIMTLGDWLAVVPVKNLLVEDSDLTDEGVRVILAGLLAAKPPEAINKRYSINSHENGNIEDRSGVVEKLSLKNNPRVTREGWKHISLFIYMCRSIKRLDLSMIPFPPMSLRRMTTNATDSNPSTPSKLRSTDAAEILSKAISERLAGAHLEELIMAECCLSPQDIRKIIDGVTISGLRRLGLAGNGLDDEGLDHVIHYLRSGVCQGLDLGGNDLRGRLGQLSEALSEHCPLWALSLADCNLTPDCLKPLFPALVSLPDFRFIDLSHNRDLFSRDPSALGILRKYIPHMKMLKRIHLVDVSLSPAQAVRLAEVLPESPNLAHLNILENPQISALATATDEAEQEEACALYASLMAAVRVSDSIICVDVDVPGPRSSEVVKALAKQVVAYSLRNMERFAAVEASEAGDGASGPKEVDVPEVLLHLVGHVEGYSVNDGDDEPAPDDDYIVGGTGVVKALSYCLSEKASEVRRTSIPASGTVTPRSHLAPSGSGPTKAKTMSKNLLDSARKIRARLQPALVREAGAGHEMEYRRLLFLDQTLQGIIQRFEDEYPECRVPVPSTFVPETASTHSSLQESASSIADATTAAQAPLDPAQGDSDLDLEDADHEPLRSRHNSDVSLASRALALEEGRIHRFGQRVRRNLLRPETADHAHGVTEAPGPEPEHIAALRAKLYELSGADIRTQLETDGLETVLERLGENASELARLQRESPEEFRKLREVQMAALANAGRAHQGPHTHDVGAAAGEAKNKGVAAYDVDDEIAVED